MPRAEADEPSFIDYTLERKRLKRDAALRRRFEAHLIPGLPVDGDAAELRMPETRVGTFVDAIVSAVTNVKEPFFDTVCDKWKELFPDFPGQPGRYREGHLFLYVGTSGLVFSLRPKLARIKKKLLTLAGAPKANRLVVHLEVHSSR